GGDEVAGVPRHRVVGVVVDLAAGDDRHPLVEQPDEGADHAGLRLAALAEEDDVVPGEQGVLELGQDGVLVAEHRRDQLLPGGDAGDGVAADLLLHRDGGPARGPELAQSGGPWCVRHARQPTGPLPRRVPTAGAALPCPEPWTRRPERSATWPTAGVRPRPTSTSDGPTPTTTSTTATGRRSGCPGTGARRPPSPAPTARSCTGAASRRRRPRPADGPLRRLYTAHAFADGDWPEVRVPGHWRSSPAFAGSDGPVLHRCRFEAPPPPPGRRAWLTFEGVFYQGDVWLDGGYLGDTEG